MRLHGKGIKPEGQIEGSAITLVNDIFRIVKKEEHTMKKFVCLLMVAMLMLALSVTVFARGEPCECGGYITYSSYTDRWTEECCLEGKTHTVTERHRVYGCDSCGDELWDDIISVTYSCGICG